jgi:hypothetical protein
MDPAKFVDIVLKALEFRTTTLTLVLGATAFAMGRMWPEKTLRPRAGILYFAPSVLASGWAFWQLRDTYADISKAVAHDTVPVFAAAWSTVGLDVSIAAAFVLLCLGIGVPKS